MLNLINANIYISGVLRSHALHRKKYINLIYNESYFNYLEKLNINYYLIDIFKIF